MQRVGNVPHKSLRWSCRHSLELRQQAFKSTSYFGCTPRPHTTLRRRACDSPKYQQQLPLSAARIVIDVHEPTGTK
eukprot:3096481-Amphidinium_carterae.1